VRQIGKQGLRVNEQIRVDRVRLIDDQNNQVGIVDKFEALSKARDIGMDLVEVAPENSPPVCRIMDYGKWLYQQKRKVRQAHKKSHHVATLKEIRLRPETEEHDLGVKVDHAREFVQKGHKVQFTMVLKGRQILHQDNSFNVLDQIIKALEDIAKIEQPGKLAGRRITMLVVPK
jgi:translation initiation factor IF-3